LIPIIASVGGGQKCDEEEGNNRAVAVAAAAAAAVICTPDTRDLSDEQVKTRVSKLYWNWI